MSKLFRFERRGFFPDGKRMSQEFIVLERWTYFRD
jgi:hypothetical protein